MQPQGGSRCKWRGQRSDVAPSSVLADLLTADTPPTRMHTHHRHIHHMRAHIHHIHTITHIRGTHTIDTHTPHTTLTHTTGTYTHYTHTYHMHTHYRHMYHTCHTIGTHTQHRHTYSPVGWRLRYEDPASSVPTVGCEPLKVGPFPATGLLISI